MEDLIGVAGNLGDAVLHEREDNSENWCKFMVAETLGVGLHRIRVVSPGPCVLVEVDGPDCDEDYRPSASIRANHPDIGAISWEDVWEAVRRQNGDPTELHATAGDYEALKSSIEEFGVLQRVITDEHGEVISGKLRKHACSQLKIDCPTEVIGGLSAEQKVQLRQQLDFCRKRLSRDDKRRVARLKLKMNPLSTDRAIGRDCGLDHKTVGTIRRDLEQSGEIPHIEERLVHRGESTFKLSRSTANTKRESVPEAPTESLELRLVRENRSRRAAAGANRDLHPDDSIQLLHCDFRKLEIEDNSVGLILADPPCGAEAIDLCEDLAKFASKKLRDDGFLLVYSGISHLPHVLYVMTPPLLWVWKVVVPYPQASHYVQGRNVVNLHRDVLIFSRGRTTLPVAIRDVLAAAGGLEKDDHEWQQSIAEESALIEAFSQPGELVVSPFGGEFTTAAACVRLGRRCLSCDIDRDEIGKERVALEREQLHGATEPSDSENLSA